MSVRTLAAKSGVSVATAHLTLSELADLGLLSEGQARHPELFWAVADRWRLRWFPLARSPLPGIPRSTRELLRMRFEDLDAPGWAEVGDRAAQAYGARVAAEGPARLYLPDRRALTWALRTWGEAGDVEERHEPSGRPTDPERNEPAMRCRWRVVGGATHRCRARPGVRWEPAK